MARRTSGRPLSRRHTCTRPRTPTSWRRPRGPWGCCGPGQRPGHRGEPVGPSQRVRAAAPPAALTRPPEHNGHCFPLPARGRPGFSCGPPEFGAVEGRNTGTLFGSCDTGHDHHRSGGLMQLSRSQSFRTQRGMCVALGFNISGSGRQG